MDQNEEIENAEGSILDAINAGIADAGGGESAEPEGSDDDGAGGTGGSEGQEGEVSSEGEAEPQGKAAAGGAEGAAEDPINDPIPDDLKDRTRTRMQQLIETAKTTTAELEEVRGQFDQVMAAITETGATPEQFDAMLNMVKGLNSGDEAGWRGALEILEATRRDVMARLGIAETPGGDKLPDDLQDLVDIGHLTAEEAKVLHGVRTKREAPKPPAAPAAPAAPQPDQQWRQVVDQARHTVATMQSALKAADPGYAAKIDRLRADGFTQRLAKIEPQKWGETFQAAYAEVTATMERERAEAAKRQNPLPGGAKHAAGAAPEPKTLEEAVMQGILAAGGRR